MNEYLREVCGQDFTAKDFRTWAGTVLAFLALREWEPCAGVTQAKKNVVQAIKQVGQRLGNTPAVCRKCYVHPALLECYLDESGRERILHCVMSEPGEDENALRPEEEAVLALLREREKG